MEANANKTIGLSELLELAISSHDLGTVNFNILRLLLEDIIKKVSKADKEPVKLGDHDANHVANYKNYIQGAPVSPMPGIMRYNPPGGQNKGPPGPGSGPASGPPGPGSGPASGPGAGPTPAGGGAGGGPHPQSTPRTPGRPPAPIPANATPRGQLAPNGENAPANVQAPSPLDQGLLNELKDKVQHLEKQLGTINDLPKNADLLHKSHKGSGGNDKDGMSVNDMWQLIQLNNRIAAAEAAIQKMASLIEDLAKELNKVRDDTHGVKAETGNLAKTNSQLAMEMSPLSDKYANADKKIDDLKKELANLKEQLGIVQSATGIDPENVPTFLKKPGKSGKGKALPPGIDLKKLTPSQLAGLTPSMLAGLSPSQIADLTPSTVGNLTPDQLSKLTPSQLSKMTPEQLSNLTPSKMVKLTPEQLSKITPSQMDKLSPEQRDHIQKMKKQHASKIKSPDVNNMTPSQIQKLTPSQINKMTPSQIGNIDPEKLEHMTPEQRQQLEKVKKAKEKGPDLSKIPREDIATIPLSELDKLKPEDLDKLTVSMLDHMTPEQREHVDKMKKRASDDKERLDKLLNTSPSQMINVSPSEIMKVTPSQLQKLSPEQREQVEKMKKKLSAPKNFKEIPPSEIGNIPISDIDQLTPSEAANITDSVKAMMTPEQLEALEKRKNSKKTAAELKGMNPEDIALIPIDDLNKLTPSEIEKITPSTLELMTDEQKMRLEEIKNAKRNSPNFDELTPEEIAAITLSTLDKLTPSEVANISDEVKALMTAEQLDKLEELRLAGEHYGKSEHGEGFSDSDGHRASHGSDTHEITDKRRNRPIPQRFRGKKGEPAGGGTEPSEDMLAEEELEIPKPALGQHMEILTMESYLASLPKEDLENMAADAVQQELQKQYAALQAMQNKLARDIQDKMELIYQKLLREIITQQLTSSPYNVIEGPEKCLGPGICKGHGVPAGIAVCQYPDSMDKGKVEVAPTGEAACPSCGNDALKSLKPPRKGRTEKDEAAGEPRSTDKAKDVTHDVAGDQAIKDMKSLMVLDLEQIREDLKSSEFGEFDENDILARLGTLWEAVKVLKANEDALSSRIAKNETLLKKMPAKTMERMNRPYGDYQENAPASHINPNQDYGAGLNPMKMDDPDQKGDDGIDKDDIQTLFNNLANVIAECADQKERIDQLVDAVRIIESGMVTKQLLIDTMSEKADKGQINTKVSYDEFGNTVDELHTQLHNLMVEGYQRNENWKKVTADLAEELAEKLDRVELAPIRAFFKSRLKKLEDRVLTMSTLLEEPDPAGTRKKLIRDQNCISCDRRVNISGITNAPILPTIGPAMATGASPSHRALDVHRLRTQRSRLETEKKEIAALEKQISNQKSAGGSSTGRNERPMSDKDMMQLVNRYVGPTSPTNANSGGGLPSMKVASQAQMMQARASVLQQNSQIQIPKLSHQGSVTILQQPPPLPDMGMEE